MQKPIILFEDEQLVVGVKPRGVLSARDASDKLSMHDLLAPRTVFPIHRLDREVTGAMVFAKTAAAAAQLSTAMGNNFVKEYLALCESAPQPDEGILEDLLFHDRFKNKTYIAKRKRAGVRDAQLVYHVLTHFSGGQAALHIRLLTGRTHQIRVQLASRRCPICGDRKYGAKTGGTLELYAWRLTFPHPDGDTMRFTLPAEFLNDRLSAAVAEIPL